MLWARHRAGILRSLDDAELPSSATVSLTGGKAASSQRTRGSIPPCEGSITLPAEERHRSGIL